MKKFAALCSTWILSNHSNSSSHSKASSKLHVQDTRIHTVQLTPTDEQDALSLGKHEVYCFHDCKKSEKYYEIIVKI